MRVYGLKNCDTCRAAVKALREAGHDDAELTDIRATPLTRDQLDRFIAQFGEKLINRRSTTWRGLDAQARECGPEALLSAHPALMKRPVIDTGDALYLGWDDSVKSSLL